MLWGPISFPSANILATAAVADLDGDGYPDIVVQGDKFRYEAASEGTADVIFRCHTHIFALLMYGRMAASDAMTAGHLAVDGDAELAAKFSQWFKGI